MGEKITIELPEWCDNKGMYALFRGRELVMYKYDGKPWMVKTSRCSRCGFCCIDCGIYERKPISETEFVCGNDALKPYVCCLTPLEEIINDKCTIRFEEM